MSLTEDDLQAIATLLQPIKNEVGSIKNEVQSVKNEVGSIRLTIENETNRNIKIIAEGYLDLTRKLDDVLKVENEKEMLLIRVNILENELRKVKEQIEKIA